MLHHALDIVAWSVGEKGRVSYCNRGIPPRPDPGPFWDSFGTWVLGRRVGQDREASDGPPYSLTQDVPPGPYVRLSSLTFTAGQARKPDVLSHATRPLHVIPRLLEGGDRGLVL